MKPGGLLIVSTPDVGSLITRLVNTERRLLGRQWFPFDNPPWHLWGFNRRSIKSCVENAGFAVEYVDPLDSGFKTTNLDTGSTDGRNRRSAGSGPYLRYLVSVTGWRSSHGRPRRHDGILNDVTRSAASPLRFEAHAAPKLRA